MHETNEVSTILMGLRVNKMVGSARDDNPKTGQNYF